MSTMTNIMSASNRHRVEVEHEHEREHSRVGHGQLIKTNSGRFVNGHSRNHDVELAELTAQNLQASRRPSTAKRGEGSVCSNRSHGSFVDAASQPPKEHKHRRKLNVDIKGPDAENKPDDDSDNENEDVLVGAVEDDDDEDAPVLPWFVPESYTIALPNAEQRTFELDWMQQLFVTITDTSSCKLGSIYGRIMLAFIGIGVICIIISSTSSYQHTPSTCENPACFNTTHCENSMICEAVPIEAFSVIDELVVIFFTIDFCLRLFIIPYMPPRLNTLVDSDWDEIEEKTARKKNRRINKDPKMTSLEAVYGMVFSFEGAIDLVSIIPFYVILASGQSGSSTSFVRVCRIFRIFKVIKSYGGIITVFKRTFSESTDALVVMATIILVTQILFACILFAFEAGEFTVNDDYPTGAYLRKVAGTDTYSPSPFDSIPTGMYWAIVTLTTVGYGDLYPVTAVGRAIAALAAVCGIFCIALPVTVIGSNFSKEFDAFQERQRRYKSARRKVKITMAREKLSQLESLKVLQGEITATADDYTTNDDGEIQLTEAQRRDIQTAFNIFDIDGSLTVSYTEMGIAMNAWGYDITVRQLHKMLVMADKDNSGQISEPEFERIVLEILKMKLATQGIHDQPHSLSSDENRSQMSDEFGVKHDEVRQFSKHLLEADSRDFHELRENYNSKFSDTGKQYEVIDGKRTSPVTTQNRPPNTVVDQIRQEPAPHEYISVDSCSHAELVRYTNSLIGANIRLSNTVNMLNEIMTRGPG